MRYYVGIILMLCALEGSAQLINNIGIKGGLSLANQTWKYKSTDMELKLGRTIGINAVITAEFFKGNSFSLTTDAGFIEKGHREKIYMTEEAGQQPGDAGTSTLEMKSGYLTFSPALKYTFPINNISPYIFTGPRIDHRISYKSDYDPALKAILEKTIFGATAGIGAEFKKDKLTWMLEGQYQHDFTLLADIEPSFSNTGMKITGNTFVINAGVKFSFM